MENDPKAIDKDGEDDKDDEEDTEAWLNYIQS